MSNRENKQWVSNAEGKELLGYKDSCSVHRLARSQNVRTKQHPKYGNRFLYHSGDLLKAFEKRKEATVPKINEPLLPRFDNFLRLKGDHIVIADAHCPLVDWEFFYKQVLPTRDELKVGKLVLAGDTLNCSAFSKFYGLIRIPWETEKEEGRKFLTACVKEFDEVTVLTANHELRYLIKLWVDYSPEILFDGGKLDIWEVMVKEMDEKLKNKVKFSVHAQCTINEKESVSWRILHPGEYRKIPLSYGRSMVEIYWQNVIVTHAHMSGWCFAPNSKAQIFDCGVFADPGLFDYKNLKPTTHYNWTESFIVIKDNEGYLFRKGTKRSAVC